jgi:monoterpene epsilon-lactone hydrolase
MVATTGQSEFDILVRSLGSAQRVAQPTIEGIRGAMDRLGDRFQPAQDIAIEAVSAGGVAAEWVRAPGASEARTVLFTHGGGYCIGSPRTHRDLVGRLSRASGARFLSIDYRLAPEHPFPAAVDDAVKAYEWLITQGIEPSRLALCGDSAGGGLALALIVALRERGIPLPATVACISPLTDLAYTGATLASNEALDPISRRDTSAALASRYLGGQDASRNPLASPLYADFEGFPPLQILVGSHEILLDNSTRLAERARAAGVEVDIEVWEAMVHIWPYFAAILPKGQEAIERMGTYLARHLTQQVVQYDR